MTLYQLSTCFLLLITVLTTAYSVQSPRKKVFTLEEDDHCTDTTDRCSNDQETHRSCSCDYICNLYGDCCFDKHLWIKHPHTSPWMCRYFPNIGYVQIKAGCKINWHGNPVIQEFCKNTGHMITKFRWEHENQLSVVPVTSLDTGITYLNFQCAVCNSDTNVLTWRLDMKCEIKELDSVTRDVRNQMKNTHGKPSIMEHIQNTKAGFNTCRMEFSKPEGVRISMHQFCGFSDVIVDCPSSWKDDTTRVFCWSYKGIVSSFHKDVGLLRYKNKHCAFCNNETREQLFCGATVMSDSDIQFDLEEILNSNENLLNSECPDGTVYDPFVKKCRDVICGQFGYSFVDGKCEKDE